MYFPERNVYHSAMKKIAFLLWVILLPALCFAGPSITVDSEAKDFGNVTAGDILEHSFAIRNTGDAELIIEKLNPS